LAYGTDYTTTVSNGALQDGDTVTTSSIGSSGLESTSGTITGAGNLTIRTFGNSASGVNANGGEIILDNVDVAAKGRFASGMVASMATPGSTSITINGTATISSSGDYASGIRAGNYGFITLGDGSVVTNGFSSDALYATGNGTITSTGNIKIRTFGDNSAGIHIKDVPFSSDNPSIMLHYVDVQTSGASSYGIWMDGGSDAQITLDGGNISTAGVGAHGVIVSNSGSKTFDGTPGSVLPSITVSGDGAAILDASGSGSLIALKDQSLSISGTAGVNTWGAKAESGGQIKFDSGSSSDGTALWATGSGSSIAVDSTADLSGSHVNLDNSAALFMTTAGNLHIGSLEGDSTTQVQAMAGSDLSIGDNNTSTNGSLINSADFAGTFTGVSALIKTGSLTQILSGQSNTVGSVNVTDGTLRFEQAGSFATIGNYTTAAGATTNIGLSNSTMIAGGVFTQAAGSTLNVTLGSSPEITADTASLDGQIVINGFANGPAPVKSSEVANGTYTVIHTANGITGDFVNNPLKDSNLDYLLNDGHISTDGRDYNLGFRLAWNEGLQNKSTGSFTLNDDTAFDVDGVLADQTVPAGGFATGWDGKSLTKAGNGLLILSAANTYTGRTTLTAGTLRTDVVDNISSSSDVIVNGGIFDLNGTNQTVKRLSGTGGEVQLNGATLTADNAMIADSSIYAGDIVDGLSSGSLTKTGDGTLTLSGKTGWTGDTHIGDGELVLDGSNSGALLVSNIIGQDNTVLSLRSGATLTGWIDPTNVSIDSISSWNMTANSLVNNINLAGKINFVAPSTQPMSVGHTLTAQNWNGQGGTVVLNTVLDKDTSVTDNIVVNGNTSGNTFVKVNNAGGSGAQTVEGIKLVEVKGLSDGTFTQSGRIVAGVYDYSLEKKGTDWFLTNRYLAPAEPSTTPPESSITPPETSTTPPETSTTPPETSTTPPETSIPPQISPITITPVVRPESASYTANLTAANTMLITRLHDRLGEPQYTDALTGEKKVTSLWLRQAGGHSEWKDNTGQINTKSNRYVVQLGGDVAQLSTDSLQRLHLGVMGGYGSNQSNSRSSVTGYSSKGTVSGYSAGLYTTWYQNDETKQGMYLDYWAQYGWFNNIVQGEDVQSETYKSSGFSSSLEMGYTHKLGEFAGSQGSLNAWYIQPQVQAIWMGVEADDHSESNGTRVSGEGNGNIQTRLGVRTYMKGYSQVDDGKNRIFQPFAELNWIHNTQEFGSKMDVVSVTQAGAHDIVEIKSGVEGQLNTNLNLWGNVGMQMGNKGYSDASAMIGAKYIF
jgi:autotransporter family porin